MQLRMQAKTKAIKGGQEAFAAIGEEDNGNFITPLIKKVYDSDRGGVQWGGLGGLLLGGLLAHTISAPSGGLISLITTIAGAGLMAYMGSKYFDKPGNTTGNAGFSFKFSLFRQRKDCCR